MKNVFVFGADEFNLSLMRSLKPSRDCVFHTLYHYRDVKARQEVPVKQLYKGALEQLEAFPGTVDAIVGYWDFPVSLMLPLLRHPFGLTSPSFEATLKCEHKLWSRLEQRKVIPEYIPAFCDVDPFVDNPRQQVSLDYPFWLKPVKSASSHLGFMIRNDHEFDAAITEIRNKIHRFADPFNYLLQFAQLPDEIADADGCHCIAESIISQGRQCTLEGYVYGGTVSVYGAVDSLREGEHGSSFSRYQYPSSIPSATLDRMTAVTDRFLTHIGFDNGPFNIEFYWDADRDSIQLLEINARISKSHCPLFMHVDGLSHHQVMIDLALGQKPDFPHRQGEYRYAAKFMWRVGSDAKVNKVPSADELQALSRRFGSTEIELHIREGMRLSELRYQDSYSYEIAEVFVAGNSEQELLQKYHAVQQALSIELQPLS
ncbi:ATP-grasp domain-containing protein [Ferrimonas sediminum]|uniref:ATP-grasp domain-containing protein n=1 Tax=Ferrimonas sediminum TaxID=718193 RepID=A0A1G8SJN2_9GAMM|nr:ATP-grasp domain-containing protein [Ferrimonas sediminum]SDJ28830.1 ATP-grasp domain-containing protein [Ferrimonas sediminum]